MRLDHLIATVPDIRATHARLLAMGFEEAWPVGPFWPAALTSGVALGGANLELVQPDAGVDAARIDTLVLAPEDREEGYAMLHGKGFDFRQTDKEEADSRMLALRGFPPEMRSKPQLICENLYPGEGEADYPFFLCLYAPVLKIRLAPANFGRPRGTLIGLSLAAPDPAAVRRLLDGCLGEIGLDIDLGAPARVAKIEFEDGSSLTSEDL